MEKQNKFRIFYLVFFTACVAVFSGIASAKSLYVITDINANPTPMQAYEIKDAPTYLQFQTTANVPSLAGGAVGIALDETNEKLFVTYEVSNTIQLVDARTFAVLSQTTAPGASNLAGIVVDQGKSKIYTVDRNTNNLYVYSWDSSTNTMTLDGGAPVALAGVTQAHGIALDEGRGRLYVGDATSMTVRFFDTSTFAAVPVELGTVDLSAEGQTVQGIAIDSVRNILYTGNAVSFTGSLQKLVKYDLNSNAISSFTLPTANDNILGIAVDEDTGNVYATTGNQASGGTDTLIVFDSNLNVLKNDLDDLGNPTGLVIPRTEVTINPLNLEKTADLEPVNSGSNLTYTICYDNILNAFAVSNVTITDDIPAGTTFVSATGAFSTTATQVIWNIASLPAGAAQTCENMVVNVTAAGDSVITNSVTIDSEETPSTTVKVDTNVDDSGPVQIPVVIKGTGGSGSFGLYGILFLSFATVLAWVTRRRKVQSVHSLILGALVSGMILMGTAKNASADWYAGVSGGLAQGNYSASDLTNDLSAKGHTITNVSVDDEDVGWKIFGGYQFNNFFALEGAYVDLGEIETEFQSSTSDLTQLLNDTAEVHPFLAEGWVLSIVGMVQPNPNWDLMAKIGAFIWEADVDVWEVASGQKVTLSDDGTDLMYGVGARFKPHPHWGGRAEWERYDIDGDWADFFSLGVEYDF